jgi:indole-3-glycerol phosphate synthase/phosphoribosylanthranilate isomerase/anthranilate synthase/indole-3-glycerol phosphate synthase/phosphoribosylanthranilate isomerase
VLTEEDFFLGSLDDLRAVRSATSLPILAKDFVFDTHQLYEIAAAGADAVLLIAAVLNDTQLSDLRELAEEELGLDALVEVHSTHEMQRATRAGATLIGVNNRSLRTFEVSLDVSVELAREAPRNALLISESGLRSADDLRHLQALGYRAFLIGETLMRADNPGEVLRDLIWETTSMPLIKVCGVTNLEDALTCFAAGVDMLGFNFFPGSPRYIAPADVRRIIQQLPREMLSVGVFVNEKSVEDVARIADLARVGAVQLHGDETPIYCHAMKDRFVIKAFRIDKTFKPSKVADYDTAAVLLDAFGANGFGGTGKRCDWLKAKETAAFVSKLVLAGGLTPENVTEAVAIVRPYAVDVCSSLETTPGRKNKDRLRAFVAAVKNVAQGEHQFQAL